MQKQGLSQGGWAAAARPAMPPWHMQQARQGAARSRQRQARHKRSQPTDPGSSSPAAPQTGPAGSWRSCCAAGLGLQCRWLHGVRRWGAGKGGECEGTSRACCWHVCAPLTSAQRMRAGSASTGTPPSCGPCPPGGSLNVKNSMKEQTNRPQSQWLSCLGSCARAKGWAGAQEAVELASRGSGACLRAGRGWAGGEVATACTCGFRPLRQLLEASRGKAKAHHIKNAASPP